MTMTPDPTPAQAETTWRVVPFPEERVVNGGYALKDDAGRLVALTWWEIDAQQLAEGMMARRTLKAQPAPQPSAQGEPGATWRYDMHTQVYWKDKDTVLWDVPDVLAALNALELRAATLEQVSGEYLHKLVTREEELRTVEKNLRAAELRAASGAYDALLVALKAQIKMTAEAGLDDFSDEDERWTEYVCDEVDEAMIADLLALTAAKPTSEVK